MLLGLGAVLLEELEHLGVFGVGDHGIEHVEDVVLHGVSVLDVVEQFFLKVIGSHGCLLEFGR